MRIKIRGYIKQFEYDNTENDLNYIMDKYERDVKEFLMEENEYETSY